eukprot:gene8625-9353_t
MGGRWLAVLAAAGAGAERITFDFAWRFELEPAPHGACNASSFTPTPDQ